MKKLTMAGALALAGTATVLAAHTGATGVVKERMESMGVLGDGVKAIATMLRGEAELDPGVIRETAETMVDHAGQAMLDLFPEGTNAAPSEARDRIWDEWEEFAELAEQLQVSAEGLGLAAENPKSPMGGSTGGMMGTDTGMGGMIGTEAPMGGMMGTDAPMGGMMASVETMMTAEMIGEMPVDTAFAMVTQSCASCHTRYRAEDD